MKICIPIFLLYLMCCIPLFSQEKKQLPEELLDAIYSQIAENNESENGDHSELYEDLLNFSQHPINLNQTNKEELEKLQFLTDRQIENILYYLYMQSPIETIYELRLVDGLYKQDIQNLLPFVYVGEAKKKTKKLKWKDVLKYGKQELLTRIDRGLETKEGYTFIPEEELSENPNKRYIGNPYYYSLKYRFRYSTRVLFGFTVEKDAGEQFWGTYQKGFDFYSVHLQLNDIGKFKTIVAGDFSASFGQGLVLNTNYGFGKSSMVTNVGTKINGLRKYSSTNEYNFLRGVGNTIKLGKIELSTFYSNKMIDGDTINGSFSSIKIDGLHRTANDLSKKNTVNIQVFGSHIAYQLKQFLVGSTLIHTFLNHSLTPKSYPYNYYYFSGTKQTAGSLDYKFRWRRLFLFGETAITDKPAIASINGLSISPISSLDLLILHRYYSPKYDVIFANAFGESSRNSNEEGLYLGVEAHLFENWKFAAYADSYRFPWLKFGIDKPSTGYDFLFQTDYTPTDAIKMYARFRFEEKEDNLTNDSLKTPTVSNYNRSSLRYVLQYDFSEQLLLKNTLESTYSQKADENPTWGFLISQDLSFSFAKIPLSIDLRYEFFDAENYENRIYSYEKDVLYAFSIPALYGKGNRWYLNFKYSPLENLSLYFKIGQTTYFNKYTIGSGLEEIEGNQKTDGRILIKWKW